jgi:hypothetical protein
VAAPLIFSRIFLPVEDPVISTGSFSMELGDSLIDINFEGNIIELESAIRGLIRGNNACQHPRGEFTK